MGVIYSEVLNIFKNILFLVKFIVVRKKDNGSDNIELVVEGRCVLDVEEFIVFFVCELSIILKIVLDLFLSLFFDRG